MELDPLFASAAEEVSREEFLKAIIAAGILANPDFHPKSWGSTELGKLGSAAICNLSWLERSVDNAYKILFEELSYEDSVIKNLTEDED